MLNESKNNDAEIAYYMLMSGWTVCSWLSTYCSQYLLAWIPPLSYHCTFFQERGWEREHPPHLQFQASSNSLTACIPVLPFRLHNSHCQLLANLHTHSGRHLSLDKLLILTRSCSIWAATDNPLVCFIIINAAMQPVKWAWMTRIPMRDFFFSFQITALPPLLLVTWSIIRELHSLPGMCFLGLHWGCAFGGGRLKPLKMILSVTNWLLSSLTKLKESYAERVLWHSFFDWKAIPYCYKLIAYFSSFYHNLKL